MAESLNRDDIAVVMKTLEKLNEITDVHLTGEIMVEDGNTDAERPALGYINLTGPVEATFSQQAKR
jgi:hypothetical protein